MTGFLVQHKVCEARPLSCRNRHRSIDYLARVDSLKVHSPGWKISRLYGRLKIQGMIVRVEACQASCIGVGEMLCIRNEVDAHLVIKPIRFREFVSVPSVAVGGPDG